MVIVESSPEKIITNRYFLANSYGFIEEIHWVRNKYGTTIEGFYGRWGLKSAKNIVGFNNIYRPNFFESSETDFIEVETLVEFLARKSVIEDASPEIL